MSVFIKWKTILLSRLLFFPPEIVSIFHYIFVLSTGVFRVIPSAILHVQIDILFKHLVFTLVYEYECTTAWENGEYGRYDPQPVTDMLQIQFRVPQNLTTGIGNSTLRAPEAYWRDRRP
jgi:hypothetical protein